MSATDALKAARGAGVELRLDGDDLVLEAAAPPPAEILDLLSRHKPGILTLLRPADNGWSVEDWWKWFEERLAAAMIDGEQPEGKARRIAYECCIVRWLELHAVRSKPDRCARCGRTDQPGNIVPFGSEPAGHAWLHPECWQQWFTARRAEAVVVLAAMGITAPAELPNHFEKNGER